METRKKSGPATSTKSCWRCGGSGTVHLWGANWRVCRLCGGEGVVTTVKKPYRKKAA